jgi:uncharacterized damage-inducible protein DinB
MQKQLLETIKSEVNRRIFEESYARIQKCLDRLTDDQIWTKPNDETNSVGNLILHLIGNVRQYMCSGIGGEKDIRERSKEFLLSSRCDKGELYLKMELLQKDVEKVVDQLNLSRLESEILVQGFTEKGMSIIIHVIEHFSYHVGQIALYTKLLTNRDLGFFEGLDLDATSN